MKKMAYLALISVALMLLANVAVAQGSVPPSQIVLFSSPGAPGGTTNRLINGSKTPPAYCKPCLFYGGDLDLNNSQADTFANENIIPGNSPTLSQIYSPFRVPEGQTWKVTGLLINSLSYPTVPDPLQTPWEIRKGIPLAGGSGGKLIAHGTAKVKMTPTGRNINGTPEYTFVVKWKKPVVLPAGKYWENVTPQCTDPNNSQCTAQGFTGFLESDMETKGGFNGYGPAEPWDDSFWNAPIFGLTWANLYQLHVQRGFPGGDALSAGVIGIK